MMVEYPKQHLLVDCPNLLLTSLHVIVAVVVYLEMMYFPIHSMVLTVVVVLLNEIWTEKENTRVEHNDLDNMNAKTTSRHASITAQHT